MAGQKYGWQDCLGGVEPGFAEKRPAEFGMRQETGDDAADGRSASASGPGAGAYDTAPQPLGLE